MISKFDNVIYIDTKADEYYAVKNNDEYILYHKNSKRGWHIHKNKKFKSKKDLIKYCNNHKKEKTKKFKYFLKMEKIFNKI